MVNLNVNSSLGYYDQLSKVICNIDHSTIDSAIDLIRESWQAGRKIFTFGNGTSALTALSYVNNWNKNIYMSTNKPFFGHCLVENVGIMMSIANDIGFNEIFELQLKNFMRPGDLVIGLSGSGNSTNVVRAIRYANANGGKTLGLCGRDGGLLKQVAQHAIWVKSNEMPIIEDIHFHFGHIVMKSLSAS